MRAKRASIEVCKSGVSRTDRLVFLYVLALTNTDACDQHYTQKRKPTYIQGALRPLQATWWPWWRRKGNRTKS
ncbi:hypothetical protein Y032_0005g2477 [Ancylostoma ceylanicum]|uniref:Uncharacterized protein n=1 Tax=Ancylostoma ceylanicum TaxID=53326 RepID=A0A016VSY7_9BILA|nr:hypothetical protein Y032_0005g2477 [Ancylostoma ceylanicum]